MRPFNHDMFFQFAASACRSVPGPADNGPNALVMADDDDPGLLTYGIEVGADPAETMNRVTDIFRGHHDYAGMATTVRWSPDGVTPSFYAWCLVTVRRDEPARVTILRIDSREWYQLAIEDAPWFALSTASSCRGWLDHQFTELKRVENDQLFGTVRDPAPPRDKHGRI